MPQGHPLQSLARFRLASAYVSAGSPGPAIELLRELTSAVPESSSFARALALNLLLIGDAKGAEQVSKF